MYYKHILVMYRPFHYSFIIIIFSSLGHKYRENYCHNPGVVIVDAVVRSSLSVDKYFNPTFCPPAPVRGVTCLSYLRK